MEDQSQLASSRRCFSEQAHPFLRESEVAARDRGEPRVLEKVFRSSFENELTEESAVLVSHAGLNFGDTQIDIKEPWCAQSEVSL